MTDQVTDRTLTRRKLLIGSGLAAAAVTLRANAQTSSTTAALPAGHLIGSSANGVRRFLGVPYAQPPVGPLRFRPPVALPAWTTPRDATRFAPSATQPNRENISEDCLHLNIYAPEGKGPFPVFVWIHGGGFTGGTPNEYDGTVFARQGIVVVNIAYRLGVFGFLDWSPILGPQFSDSANNALRDITLALRWVHTNIAAVGGDASRVTIGGESAGAKLCDLLMASDEARPFFSSVISESGGAERLRPQAASAEVTAVFEGRLSALGVSAADALTAPPATLLAAQKALIDAWPANFPLRAESGGAFFPHRAIERVAQGSSRGKRLLIGTNRDESALFLGDHPAAPLTQRNLGNITAAQFAPVFDAYQKLYPDMTPAQRNIRALSAEEYWLPSIRLAQAHTKAGGTAWFYRLDEEATIGQYKGQAYHSFDIGFVWDRLAKSEPAASQSLAHQINTAWAAFIKGNAPAAPGLPPWPQWNTQTRPTMILADSSRIAQQPFQPELDLWTNFRFD